MACPGTKVTGPRTGVLGTGRSSTTMTLVMVMVPELLTVPVKMSNSPGATGLGGQCLVRDSLGVSMMGQRAVALAVTLLPVQTSLACAKATSEIFVSQILMGTG